MASQLFHRISWSHVISLFELIASNEEHLSNYFEASKKSVFFDKYQDIPAKDQDRVRQASGDIFDYDLSIASHLPLRDAKMKTKYLPTSKVASILARLLHHRQGLIV